MGRTKGARAARLTKNVVFATKPSLDSLRQSASEATGRVADTITLICGDGIHPNDVGYDAWARHIADARVPSLRRSPRANRRERGRPRTPPRFFFGFLSLCLFVVLLVVLERIRCILMIKLIESKTKQSLLRRARAAMNAAFSPGPSSPRSRPRRRSRRPHRPDAPSPPPRRRFPGSTHPRATILFASTLSEL